MKELKRLTDEELMIRYQKAADERAFDELYFRYSGRLFGYMYKKLGNKTLSEDILQMTFLNAHKNKEKYDPEYPFSGWIFTLCRNAMVDMLRKDKRQEIKVVQIDDVSPAVEEIDSVEVPDVLLNQLPHNQKKAVQMRYRQEKTFEEISKVLNTSEHNSRKLVSRGLQHLRKLMKGSSS
jgi:RNA polymerase sigma-70 factor, ECF subfamily